MQHPICRVQRFEIVVPYTRRIDFNDTTQQVIDFLPVLRGEFYGLLRDLALFNQVVIDPEIHTLVWPNGADFDPATLHEWPRCGAAFAEMARAWEPVIAHGNAIELSNSGSVNQRRNARGKQLTIQGAPCRS